MKNNRIANVYAKSLLLEAEKQKCVKVVCSNMDELQVWWDEVEAFKHLLTTAIISPEKKLKVWQKLATKAFHPLSVSFLSLLIKHNREAFLGDVLVAFRKAYRASQGIVSVSVESAEKLSEKQLQSIRKKITKNSKAPIEITTKVNPALIGGFILTKGNERVDLSIKGRLQSIKEKLTN